MMLRNVLGPEGRLIIAQQFTAGAADRNHFARQVTVPSDESLGYSNTQLNQRRQ